MNTQQQTQSPHGKSPFGNEPPSLIGKIIGLLLSAAFLVVAFMFSLVALAIVACGAVLFGSWLWWKTRAARKLFREQAARQAGREAEAGGRIIEGEVLHSDSPRPSGGAFLPRN